MAIFCYSSDSGVISESHSSICDEDLPHHDEIEDHELSSSPDRSEELACQLDCFCHTLKKWLHEQGKRDRNILLEDEHYRERAQNYVVDVKTIKEAMLSAFDPIPTLR